MDDRNENPVAVERLVASIECSDETLLYNRVHRELKSRRTDQLLQEYE
jgi:hypothetical protein